MRFPILRTAIVGTSLINCYAVDGPWDPNHIFSRTRIARKALTKVEEIMACKKGFNELLLDDSGFSDCLCEGTTGTYLDGHVTFGPDELNSLREDAILYYIEEDVYQKKSDKDGIISTFKQAERKACQKKRCCSYVKIPLGSIRPESQNKVWLPATKPLKGTDPIDVCKQGLLSLGVRKDSFSDCVCEDSLLAAMKKENDQEYSQMIKDLKKYATDYYRHLSEYEKESIRDKFNAPYRQGLIREARVEACASGSECCSSDGVSPHDEQNAVKAETRASAIAPLN